MSIQFICPHCENLISIDGLDYKLCPVCGYNEKMVQHGEVLLHEETIRQGEKKSFTEVVSNGLKKLKSVFGNNLQ